MKRETLNCKYIYILSIFLFALFSCEDEISVPPASTQADFSYEFSTFVNEESGRINYQVEFTNLSLNAVAYHWDFGNGETSTEENPVAIYDEDGLYEVTSTVPPEQELHYNVLVKSDRLSLVSTIFFEGFDDPDLEFNFPPEGWTLIDLDGDGHNWYWDTTEGEFYILSDSWHSGTDQALTPDNWIITPQIDLSDVGGANLEYKVTPRASGASYRLERYAVLISTTGTDVEDFVEIFAETLQPDMENWVWVLRELDISSYAGEKIHIALRHFECTDMWSIVMTDIHIYETSGE